MKKFVAVLLFLFVSVSLAFGDDIYDVTPSYTYPHYSGVIKDSVLKSALAELNNIRKIVGVPSNVKLDSEYTKKAQHGAVLLDIINTLTHEPGKPSGMTDSFYNNAYDATTHSNLGWGYQSIEESLKGYMEDEKVASLGHRLWLMNPRMKKTGFGFSTRNNYTATYVIDEDSLKNAEWPISDEFITWPSCKNSHPLEYFKAGIKWSVTLCGTVFEKSTASSVNVKLTRNRDSKTWNFTGSQISILDTPDNQYDECIIFAPDGVDKYNDGEKWSVEISGLTRKDGNAGNISYNVKFGTAADAVNDNISLQAIDSDEPTKNSLKKALKTEDINFISDTDLSGGELSTNATQTADEAGFEITKNYKSITAKKGINAFKIHASDIIRKSVGEIKIYLAKKNNLNGGSINISELGDVVEAQLFDVNGNSLNDSDKVPEQILVTAELEEGDYTVHLAEKKSTLPDNNNNSNDNDSGSGGCNFGYGSVALLILGIHCVKFSKRVGDK